MRITLIGAGSRGDVQPLVAVGQRLAHAHDVTVAAPGDFATLITGAGLAFRELGGSMHDLLLSDLARDWLGHSSHSGPAELRALTRLVRHTASRNAETLLSLAGSADLFISSVLVVDAIDALVTAHGGRHVPLMFSPLQPTRAGWAGLMPPMPARTNRINLAASWLTVTMAAGAFQATGHQMRRRLGQRTTGRRPYLRAVCRTPSVLAVSPTVLPSPPDWHRTTVSGYCVLPPDPTWQPPPELTAFLNSGPPPVYLGWGSMSTRHVAETTRIVLAALAATGRRGLVHRGVAMSEAQAIPDRLTSSGAVLFVDDVPHEWLFPRVAGVVHHGGAGTVAAGLRAGVPSAVVSHIGDQPYWGRRLGELGVGPAPIRRHQLSTTRLADLIRGLDDPQVRRRASELGARIRDEDGVAATAQALLDHAAAAR